MSRKRRHRHLKPYGDTAAELPWDDRRDAIPTKGMRSRPTAQELAEWSNAVADAGEHTGLGKRNWELQIGRFA